MTYSKYIVTFFIFSLCISFITIPKVLAQTGTGQQGLRFSCLEATHCKRNSSCTKESVHRALLTPNDDAKAVPNDINTYLTECLDIDSDNNGVPETMCTTGSSNLDKELFCGNAASTDPQCDHFQMLKDKVGYSLDRGNDYGIFFIKNNQAVKQTPSKIASDGLGNIIPPKIEIQSYTEKSTTRRYLIWNKVDVQRPDPAGVGGQQQNDLEFATRSSSCAGISWDPYGRLFDTKTLEPIPDGQVTIKQLDPDTNGMNEAYANRQNPNIINPFTTNKNGVFSFIVVDGDYSLTPVHSNYTHSTATRTALELANPNMPKIYSDYYNSTAPVIQQRGAIQHRDIPMEPNNATGYMYPLVIVDQLEELLNNGNLRYSGNVSHPFAQLKVQICGYVNAQEVCDAGTTYTSQNGGPDKNGKFSIELDQKKLELGQYYKKIFNPVSLTTGTLSKNNTVSSFFSLISYFFSFDVSAQESDRSVTTETQPIASYIEGYAYDGQGNLLPNAQVGIYVSFSDRPVYTTTTTAGGYYKITSEYLPRTSYTIRYTSPRPPYVQTLITTSQFMIQNKDFLEAEKVNVYLVTSRDTDPRRTVTPSYIPNQKTTPLPNVTQITQKPTGSIAPSTVTTMPATPARKNDSLLFIGLGLLILSVVGAFVVYLMMKKKNQIS